ncbi:galactose mutarotase [Methylobacterium sp. C25]|uniref:aldose epimerase family protein n=1 Tax=Methylobacterium sp. C25 TaxID=2721622 RepID=UPI001F46F573|nr:aldose epimerase family protein [Methylobacterium sp. C25]MCE4222653.1 galactose mutarotase [Methylobacterium sp. C25]
MAGEIFGKTKGGEIVSRLTLERGNFRVQVLDYGGIITTIETPDRQGRLANIVLGLDSVEGYETVSPHFGALAGRYANRIASGRFTLDGTAYELPINNPPNTLHGGVNGFAKRLFRIEAADAQRVVLMRRSPDGEEGFPGNLDLEVVYSLPEDGVLRIDYRAFTDKPTVLNLTNHSYFNLAGEGSGDVMGHVVEIAADAYTPTDAGQIPTGEIRSVEGTPFDFRKATAVGQRIRQDDPQIVLAKGYDHNFVLRNAGGGLRPAASCLEPSSGRRLDIATTQPAVQLYTGNNLDGTLVGPSKRTYRSGDGVCFETQGFPDAPNHPDFPSTVLRSGAPFVSTTTFRFSVA